MQMLRTEEVCAPPMMHSTRPVVRSHSRTVLFCEGLNIECLSMGKCTVGDSELFVWALVNCGCLGSEELIICMTQGEICSEDGYVFGGGVCSPEQGGVKKKLRDIALDFLLSPLKTDRPTDRHVTFPCLIRKLARAPVCKLVLA